jgi:putative ABC transport system substrate-binding protein
MFEGGALRSDRTSITSISLNLRATRIAKHSWLNSSSTLSIRYLRPSLVRSSTTRLAFRDPSDIERGIDDFARAPNGGLFVLSDPSAALHRELIVALAARHQLPAVYPFRQFVTIGGLISYGVDRPDQYRRAAEYVSRILKGEKPADLPVQTPTKYELVINLKTARALSIDISDKLLTLADEVIDYPCIVVCGA